MEAFYNRGLGMRVILWSCLMCLLTSTSMAANLSCIDKLLPSSRYSGTHQLSKQEWSDGKNELDPVAARQAIQALVFSKLLCKQSELSLTLEPSCSHMLADRDDSHVCYAETNLGYFFLTKDQGRTVNFIFSRR
jgi:hypothetical protein